MALSSLAVLNAECAVYDTTAVFSWSQIDTKREFFKQGFVSATCLNLALDTNSLRKHRAQMSAKK